jgi:hypothetical protein
MLFMHKETVSEVQKTNASKQCSVECNLTSGMEPEEALEVVNDCGAEVLRGDGGLDPVQHSKRGILEAPPSFRRDGRGLWVRRRGLEHRRAVIDVHHGARPTSPKPQGVRQPLKEPT